MVSRPFDSGEALVAMLKGTGLTEVFKLDVIDDARFAAPDGRTPTASNRSRPSRPPWDTIPGRLDELQHQERVASPSSRVVDRTTTVRRMPLSDFVGSRLCASRFRRWSENCHFAHAVFAHPATVLPDPRKARVHREQVNPRRCHP